MSRYPRPNKSAAALVVGCWCYGRAWIQPLSTQRIELQHQRMLKMQNDNRSIANLTDSIHSNQRETQTCNFFSVCKEDVLVSDDLDVEQHLVLFQPVLGFWNSGTRRAKYPQRIHRLPASHLGLFLNQARGCDMAGDKYISWRSRARVDNRFINASGRGRKA